MSTVYFTKNDDEIIQIIVGNRKGVCECGAVMNTVYENEQFVCPNCGNIYDIDEYEDNGPYSDLTYGVFIDHSLNDDIPEGCSACGGPYPDCKTSCSIFDD